MNDNIDNNDEVGLEQAVNEAIIAANVFSANVHLLWKHFLSTTVAITRIHQISDKDTYTNILPVVGGQITAVTISLMSSAFLLADAEGPQIDLLIERIKQEIKNNVLNQDTNKAPLHS